MQRFEYMLYDDVINYIGGSEGSYLSTLLHYGKLVKSLFFDKFSSNESISLSETISPFKKLLSLRRTGSAHLLFYFPYDSFMHLAMIQD